MRDKFELHFWHYLALFFLLAVGCFFFLISSHRPRLQLKILLLVLLFYLLWGGLHHYIEKTLTLATLLEYLLVASMVFVIIFSLLRFA